jgi:hypothetical protein
MKEKEKRSDYLKEAEKYLAGVKCEKVFKRKRSLTPIVHILKFI